MVKEFKAGDNFDEIIKDKDVLVDFYADWCGPCKMQAPILDTITEVEVLKVNVDSNQELAMKYGIFSIPTLMVVKNGEIIKQEPGFKTKDQILDMFK